jgi:hypothetical protein
MVWSQRTGIKEVIFKFGFKERMSFIKYSCKEKKAVMKGERIVRAKRRT